MRGYMAVRFACSAPYIHGREALLRVCLPDISLSFPLFLSRLRASAPPRLFAANRINLVRCRVPWYARCGTWKPAHGIPRISRWKFRRYSAADERKLLVDGRRLGNSCREYEAFAWLRGGGIKIREQLPRISKESSWKVETRRVVRDTPRGRCTGIIVTKFGVALSSPPKVSEASLTLFNKSYTFVPLKLNLITIHNHPRL